MKTIGFIDYYLSEWHANNYPQWINDANEKLGTDYQVAYAWAEEDVSPIDGVTTDEWCRNMGVSACKTIEELCEKSDVILILAPSNPEKHLQYAQEALKFGKRTYIDKTFSTDYETAKKIFDIAEENNTSFFSTSALRYADELKEFANANNIIITGGGSNFPEYLVHTVEMAVVLLASPAKKVKVECMGDQRICRVIAENMTQAAIVYSPAYGFGISAEASNGRYVNRGISSNFFANLITSILKFYEDGNLPFDTEQTLEVMHLRDGLLRAENNDGNWIEL